jgi:HEAT repeat protein
MTGSQRKLGLALLVFLCLPQTPVFGAQDELQTKFNEGVELLRRGKDAEALAAFQAVLAMDPSHEQAYELWKATDHQVWLDILVKQGDFELVARRLVDLTRMGRAEKRSDAAAIQAALTQLRSEDILTRTRAKHQLAAEHGEYAVPYMIPALGDRGDEDRRVILMHALTEMDTDVVVPLIEALNAEDAFLRRNVALTLGYIGDERAAGMLAWLAASDPDGAAQAAAAEALGTIGSRGGALGTFVRLGHDYHERNENVLAAHLYSDVMWDWNGTTLTSRPVPREIYNDEMAMRNYERALIVDPTSLDARAGLARSYVVEWAKLEDMAAAGQDVAALQAAIDEGSLAVQLAGYDALDRALAQSLESGDVIGAVAVARACGEVAPEPNPALRSALESPEASLRGEAALAMAKILTRNAAKAGNKVVGALGEAAGREIVRMGAVIDGDPARAQTVASGLAGLGVTAQVWNRGAQALAMLRRVPGLDVVLVSTSLPDLTTFQVIDDVRSDARFEKTPILVIAAGDSGTAEELFGDKTQGIVADPADLSAVASAMEGELGGDRARADALSAQAAEALASLAMGGSDTGPALEGLTRTLASRPDRVILPAMQALRVAGTQAQVPALTTLLADGARSEESRIAAGRALAAILARGAQGDEAALTAVMDSDAPTAVRRAAALALGSQQLGPARRAELLRKAAAKGTQPK